MEKEPRFDLDFQVFADIVPPAEQSGAAPSEFETVVDDRLEIDLNAPVLIDMGALAVEAVNKANRIRPEKAVALGNLALAR